MQKRMFTIGFILALVVVFGMQSAVVEAMRDKAGPTKFKVRIETNIWGRS